MSRLESSNPSVRRPDDAYDAEKRGQVLRGRTRVRVFVAGATGAIGRPLVARLLEAGHEVVGTTRSEERANDLRTRGAEAAVVNALDAGALVAAVRRARPEAVVQQLTALPKAAAAGEQEHAATSRLRVEGTRALLRGAPDARVVAQSVAFLTRPDGRPIHDEDAELFVDGPGSVGVSARAVRDMEADVTKAGGISLRYGFFYGPGTWYHREGASARDIAEGRAPLVGDGQGRWPWLHVDDAVSATLAALECGEGALNICDDEPAPVAEWMPYAARLLGADPPPRITVLEALETAGPKLVHYHTTMPGASNARAKGALGWTPSWPEWRRGFEHELGDQRAASSPL
jgi:nucleoside-diphosphate-sugar epimerase